jgi:polysaccharide biosynthesis protein PslG
VRAFLKIVTLAMACATVPSPVQVVRSNETVTKPVSFAILEDYDKDDQLEEIARDFALFNELDIRTWRGSFGWDDYEPSRRQYDFQWLERFAALAAQHQITLRPYIGYTPKWAARPTGSGETIWNRPPARRDDWRRFVTALARAMKRHTNVVSYEIYNEENVPQWWDGSAADYARTLTDASDAIGRVDRQMPIIFGGLVFPDAEWLEQACASRAVRNGFDVLPVHAYPETWTPPGVTVESYAQSIGAFIPDADSACGRKPVWINETGFATVTGRSERDQANWWVRAVAAFLAQPRIEHIGVYEIKDLPLDRKAIGDTPNYHLGLTRVDRSKKLAFHTVDMLTDLLDTGRLTVAAGEVKVVPLRVATGELHQHVFIRPDGDAVLIMWNRTTDLRVGVAGPFSSITEYLLDGRQVPISSLTEVALVAGEPRVFRLTRTSR